MSKDLLLGTWKLVSFEYKSNEELLFYPYGKNPSGRMYYDKEGFMAIIISRKDRPLLSASDDLIKVREHEKARLPKGFIAYSGKYEIFTDKIVHHLDICFIPNWVGTAREFYYTFNNEYLLLSTPLQELRGIECIGYMNWSKKPESSF